MMEVLGVLVLISGWGIVAEFAGVAHIARLKPSEATFKGVTSKTLISHGAFERLSFGTHLGKHLFREPTLVDCWMNIHPFAKPSEDC